MSNEKFIDISMDICPEMIVYDGDDKFSYTTPCNMENGDICNTWQMSLNTHTGTHLDAPRHFVKDGVCIDELPISYFAGVAKVIEIKDSVKITKNELLKYDITGCKKILFKTENSKKTAIDTFCKDYIYIALDAAEHLVECGVELVGIDYLSVEKFGNHTHDTHKKLLENNVALLEGIRLEKVSEGDYYLIALPLKIKGSNGSPVRAVLQQL